MFSLCCCCLLYAVRLLSRMDWYFHENCEFCRWWCVQLLCARVFVVCDSFWRFQFRFVFSFPFSLVLLPYLSLCIVLLFVRSFVRTFIQLTVYSTAMNARAMWIDTFVFTAPFGICAFQFNFFFVLYDFILFVFPSVWARVLCVLFFVFLSGSGWIRIQMHDCICVCIIRLCICALFVFYSAFNRERDSAIQRT